LQNPKSQTQSHLHIILICRWFTWRSSNSECWDYFKW